MCRSDVRFSRTKTTVAGVCAAMMLAAACGAPAPTASAESPGTVAGPVGPEPTAVRAEPAETHSVVAGHPTATSPTGLVDVPVHRPGPGIVNPIVISSPRPAYTPDAMRRKVQGQVQLEAVIDPTGRVTDATVVKPLDPDLDASAVAAARQWRFEPAKLDGKPVTIAVMLVMQFDIY